MSHAGGSNDETAPAPVSSSLQNIIDELTSALKKLVNKVSKVGGDVAVNVGDDVNHLADHLSSVGLGGVVKDPLDKVGNTLKDDGQQLKS